MLRKFFLFTSATLTCWALASAFGGNDVIANFMKNYHKAAEGADSVSKKAGNGDATESELAGLLAGYQAIAAIAPPQGDAASWKQKTEAVIAAVKALQSGAENATADYQAAVNCKACHSAHKP